LLQEPLDIFAHICIVVGQKNASFRCDFGYRVIGRSGRRRDHRRTERLVCSWQPAEGFLHVCLATLGGYQSSACANAVGREVSFTERYVDAKCAAMSFLAFDTDRATM